MAARTEGSTPRRSGKLADVNALGGGVPIMPATRRAARRRQRFKPDGDEACAKAGIAKVADQARNN